MIHRIMLAAVGLLLIVCVTGCYTRTVYVSAGTPVRLRETIHNVKIWAPNAADEYTIAGRVTLHEGWYAMFVAPAAKP